MAKEHGQRKCRNETDKDILWSVADLQSWSQNGKRDFWIVADRGKENLPVLEQSPRRKRRFSEMPKEEMDPEARRQQSMGDGNQEDLLHLSNWMRRTSWATTFAGTDLSLLGKLSRTTWMSDDEGEANDNGSTAVMISAVDEQNIAIVGAAVDRFHDQCEETLRHTDHSIRCCLRSHFPGRPTSHRSSFRPAILRVCDTALCGREWFVFAFVSIFSDMIFARTFYTCPSLPIFSSQPSDSGLRSQARSTTHRK
jgi:hypothetical protein